MGQRRTGISKCVVSLAMAVAGMSGVQAREWQVSVGAESAGRGSQALAFLPNELWIHAGDSIRWSFPTHERHTVTLLTAGQTRPPGFGPVFGIPVGCPGLTPDASSFDGSACVSSGVLQLADDAPSTAAPQTYSVIFPSPGNFKFVCLIHADMTGMVHVRNASDTLPYDQDFYAAEAQSAQSRLLADAARLAAPGVSGRRDPAQGNVVAAGAGQIVTTGGGSDTASLMRFLRDTIVVQVGETVEWTNLDPSINHTVTFGVEPADPRPVSTNVTLSSDGARQAVIHSTGDNVNSGFLSPTPQDRANLAQAPPGVTRFRVTFTTPGTFHYICAVHDQLGMVGTVLVF